MQAQRRAEKAFARVVARSWHDESYRRALLREPARVFRAAGLNVPAGVRVRVHEESEREMHVVIPSRPAGALGEAVVAVGSLGPQLTTQPPPQMKKMDDFVKGKAVRMSRDQFRQAETWAARWKRNKKAAAAAWLKLNAAKKKKGAG